MTLKKRWMWPMDRPWLGLKLAALAWEETQGERAWARLLSMDPPSPVRARRARLSQGCAQWGLREGWERR